MSFVSCINYNTPILIQYIIFVEMSSIHDALVVGMLGQVICGWNSIYEL